MAAPFCAERMCAALRSLLWLVTYVAVMRLLGYRIPRAPAARKSAAPAHPIPPAATPAPTTPPAPRQKHRYLDRAMCLNLLADISRAFAPAQPAAPAFAPIQPVPTHPAPVEPHDRAPAPSSLRPPPRQSRPAVINRSATTIPRAHPIRAPAHPACFQNTAAAHTPTHALFVAIS